MASNATTANNNTAPFSYETPEQAQERFMKLFRAHQAKRVKQVEHSKKRDTSHKFVPYQAELDKWRGIILDPETYRAKEKSKDALLVHWINDHLSIDNESNLRWMPSRKEAKKSRNRRTGEEVTLEPKEFTILVPAEEVGYRLLQAHVAADGTHNGRDKTLNWYTDPVNGPNTHPGVFHVYKQPMKCVVLQWIKECPGCLAGKKNSSNKRKRSDDDDDNNNNNNNDFSGSDNSAQKPKKARRSAQMPKRARPAANTAAAPAAADSTKYGPAYSDLDYNPTFPAVDPASYNSNNRFSSSPQPQQQEAWNMNPFQTPVSQDPGLFYAVADLSYDANEPLANYLVQEDATAAQNSFDLQANNDFGGQHILNVQDNVIGQDAFGGQNNAIGLDNFTLHSNFNGLDNFDGQNNFDGQGNFSVQNDFNGQDNFGGQDDFIGQVNFNAQGNFNSLDNSSSPDSFGSQNSFSNQELDQLTVNPHDLVQLDFLSGGNTEPVINPNFGYYNNPQ
ncbi:hypothetical protein GTA08_BOTSDO00173 [Botryosphaeria dothidea]|uniref:Uncharacterized protein n=1 Tax=Botryosphaeria dothidea TaxID=55169 RepID=A0A8H4J7G4_9PEZI|nr:hypothetical protein GTA08_BOTSDO00173 [Botryosphaeria dothidea]